jgi:hypothetical protein
METGWIVIIVLSVGCSLAAAYLKPWIDRRKRAAKFRAAALAEAAAARTRQAASGIKGDGFSALFLLHRALHHRIRGVGWAVWAGILLVCSMGLSHIGWWAWGPAIIAVELCFFRASYFAAKATALTEIAEEAVKHQGEQTEGKVEGD